MKIYTETSLSDFKFWGGAEDLANELTEEQFNIIEAHFEEQYPDGMTEEDVNDIFRFDEDYVAQLLGYDNWEEFMHKDGDKPDLPTELIVDCYEIDDDWDEFDEDEKGDAVSEYLSNEYEYCHDGFDYKELENGNVYIVDIRWDTEE